MMKKLYDITPIKYRCAGASSMCPAVLNSEVGTYVIIGKRINHETTELCSRVGPDEAVVEISSELLETALASILKQQ